MGIDKMPTVHKRAGEPKEFDESVQPALYPIRLNVCHELGIKAPEFAKLMYCTPQTMYKWERSFDELSDINRFKVLSILSSVYGIPAAEFETGTTLILYYARNKKAILNHVSKLRG